MRVLGLCSYPIEAAATRYRLVQYVEPLARRGIELDVRPFLSSEAFKTFYKSPSPASVVSGMLSGLARRLADVFNSRRYDLVLVQREAMMFGPALFESLIGRVARCPIVLDLDDATFLSYVSPTYGRFASYFKFFGKTDNLIRRSSMVLCGNDFIADHVRALGVKAVIVPTVVDTNVFVPKDAPNETTVVGWIGTHSTYPFLESILPVIDRLGLDHEFILRIVGSGREKVRLENVVVENLEWELNREVADFRSLDIGLYPIRSLKNASDEWLKGKSGFKAIQYLSVGVPFVVSPVGVCRTIGQPELTHFEAENDEQWFESVRRLLTDREKRSEMGIAGREFALSHYTIDKQSQILEDVFRGALR